VGQRGAIFSYVGGSPIVAGVPDESHFHNVANRRDARTFDAVFEIKKEFQLKRENGA
jgi:hypothetical protein